MTDFFEKTARFQKIYKKLNKNSKNQVVKALQQFIANPKHPSLNYECVLIKKGVSYHTIRVTLSNRIVLVRYEEDGQSRIKLVDYGGHEVYRRLMRTSAISG